MINATSNGSNKNFQPIEAGTYPARCYSMIHIGTVTETFQGESKQLNKVRISWELPNELKEFKEGEGERPFVISKEFTLSLHEKATLRKFLESWRGKTFTEAEAKKFDVSTLLGLPCMVSVIHKTSQNGKTYAEISGVSTVIKGFTVPPQINPTQVLSYDNFNYQLYDTLPQFLKDKISTSVEFNALVKPTASAPVSTNKENDDLPF